MNKPMEAKRAPEVKPWVRRVVEAAGVVLPANADGERRLGWWGVETRDGRGRTTNGGWWRRGNWRTEEWKAATADDAQSSAVHGARLVGRRDGFLPRVW